MPPESLVWLQAGSPLFEPVLALRHEVFVVEQGVPEELETDAHDVTARHLAALRGAVEAADGDVTGTLRLRVQGRKAKVGRVAVRRSDRRRGLGTRLMEEAQLEAGRQGCEAVMLDAQTYVVGFYEHLGYTVVSEPFLDAGILHVRMTRPV